MVLSYGLVRLDMSAALSFQKMSRTPGEVMTIVNTPRLVRTRSRALAQAVALAALAPLVPGLAVAASFNVVAGTDTVAKTLNAGETGTVAAGAALSVSGGTNTITLGATNGITTINNSGNILQTGTGRTIRNNTSGTPNFLITNNSGALIRSANGDTIRADVAGSSWTINNSGTIQSLNPALAGSQAIDFDAVTTGTVSITNTSSGQILAYTADAVRPGANATISNAGTIAATLNPLDTAPSSDGVDTQQRSGVSVTNSGTISGRHAITGGDAALASYSITVQNDAGGVISGVNGSGINIDGVFATATANVTNAFGATIQGGVGATFADGDGDGVDVDGVVSLNNSGDILGYGAKGNGSDGGQNNAEAIAIGGGTIVNTSTGRIIGSTLLADAPNGDTSRAGSGILVDNSSGGNAVAATSITNGGLIQGRTGNAIRIVGTFADTVTNQATGTIRGAGTGAAVQTGGGGDVVNNAGAIIGDNGQAIDLQAGDDTLNITGGTITGDVSGGAGTDVLTLNLGLGSFAYADSLSDFSTVEVISGVTTLSGTSIYTGVTRLTGGTLVLDGANRLNSGSALDLNGGALELVNAGGPNGQTFASLAVSESSTIDLNLLTSLSFGGLGSLASGKTLAILGYDTLVSPNYAFRVNGDYLLNAAFQALVAGTTIDGLAASMSFDGSYTNVGLAAVPVPGAWTLLLSAFGMLGAARRRRPAA